MPTGGDGTAYMGEKMDLKKADMGDVITDFRKSDAPQFKGKSDKKIQKMAIAAKLDAMEALDREDVPVIKGIVKKLEGASKKHKNQALALKKAVDENVMLTYRSGQGFDAKLGGKSVRNTVKNIKTGVDAVKNIKKEGGLVSGIKKTINDKKTTNTKTDVSTNVSDAIKNFKMKEDTAMNEQLGGTGPKVAPSSEEMKKKLTKTVDFKTGGTIKKPTVIMPDGKELPGLGGGGGGTNAITAKAKTKTLKNYMKDAVKIATFPISRRNVKPDPTEKFATEDTAIESELVIQDWNVDDIKFTEIETVDIIKAKPLKENMSNWRDELDEDWQKVNRKDKTDGLSKKAVKAYRSENPGSKLKTAVTKDPKKLKKGSKSAKRRLAFCRRMKGMKKKLTSAKTRRDPDSRINKALRRWNC